MFSQKKRNYTWIYVLVISLLVIFGLMLILSTISNRNTDLQRREPQETDAYQSENEVENSSLPTAKPVPENDSEKEENNSSYYLVKYDNNSIKIFFSEKTGSLVELEKTEIVYETLSEEDQQRFNKGIKVLTREELNRVLMDYEG